MIDLKINEKQLKNALKRAKEKGIIIPTLEQQRDPVKLVPDKIKKKLDNIGLWDVHPLNLFRITWHNEPKAKGGEFGGVNYLEFPESLTGVPARIIALVGKWFPTGAHKVGAAFGCLVPRLTTGQFDPINQKAVWPSTGNYCRGGAYDSALLGCESIAILPEGMSKERFQWLSKIAGEVIATPGSESNVKEIFDKCWELRKSGQNLMIFNQFEEFGNYLWHYYITGHAIEEVLKKVMKKADRYSGVVSSTGSAGTIGCGDYLKQVYPDSKIAAAEALQCPTLYNNGFGAHRIEGIGDKHVPWIHNIRNTDVVIANDDEDCMRILRLFNEPKGREFLVKEGVPESLVNELDLLGISGVGNLVGAIKMAKYYELTKRDVIVTILTDSMELYGSRITELREQYGNYDFSEAKKDYHRHIQALKTDYLLDLTYAERKRVHNLKYYTWIEQQGRELKELNQQWYEWPEYWEGIQEQISQINKLIEEFNRQTGLLNTL
ncbi:MAG TPA: pyridoxal-phosphate dependent enzyme [bacterium]|nr:pyridoxal-phosphate dependent enzyme [bacterium]